MNNQRKIRQEIDKTHKKIREGFEVFSSLWDKVDKATDHSTKQRWTSELKKELKKLQRLRDQIKAWLSNGVVKDTKEMEQYKHEIESKMEVFKELEREVKTKTYDGGAHEHASSKAPTFDPEANPRLTKCVDWLKECVNNLEEQITEAEGSLDEEIELGRRGDQELIEQLQSSVESHKWHIENLSSILDMVYNGDVGAKQIEVIKDDIDYYIESNQDEDFYEDDGVYDEFQKLAAELGEESSEEESSSDDEAAARAAAARRKAEAEAAAAKKAKAEEEAKAAEKKAARLAAEKERRRQADLERQREEAQKKQAAQAEARKRQQLQQQQALEMQRQKNMLEKQRQHPQHQQSQPQQPIYHRQQQNYGPQSQQRPPQQYSGTSSPAVSQHGYSQEQSAATTVRAALHEAAAKQPGASPDGAQPRSIASVLAGFLGEEDAKNLRVVSGGNRQAGLRLKAQEDMLEHSLNHLPAPEDSDCRQAYRPLNPMPELSQLFGQPTGADWYEPARQFEQNGGRLFEKLSTDTLFYIFYHEKGTYRQCLAAQELKRGSWRFHKKYMTWFQRHEEPRVADKTFEQGTYVYFDYETGWLQRIKSDFRFEYVFLEDEL